MKTKTEIFLLESCLFIFEHLSSDWFSILNYAHAKLTSLISEVWLAVKMSAYTRRTNQITIWNLARPKAENVNKTLTKIKKITTLKIEMRKLCEMKKLSSTNRPNLQNDSRLKWRFFWPTSIVLKFSSCQIDEKFGKICLLQIISVLDSGNFGHRFAKP